MNTVRLVTIRKSHFVIPAKRIVKRPLRPHYMQPTHLLMPRLYLYIYRCMYRNCRRDLPEHINETSLKHAADHLRPRSWTGWLLDAPRRQTYLASSGHIHTRLAPWNVPSYAPATLAAHHFHRHLEGRTRLCFLFLIFSNSRYEAVSSQEPADSSAKGGVATRALNVTQCDRLPGSGP